MKVLPGAFMVLQSDVIEEPGNTASSPQALRGGATISSTQSPPALHPVTSSHLLHPVTSSPPPPTTQSPPPSIILLPLPHGVTLAPFISTRGFFLIRPQHDPDYPN
ncbi:hypothetical protein EYF80_064148 [Liparis tanakae]|uniref:Uncharacterized protein n=1 Tax=Liparis tanakae TaxID=230148 RepID=A0A4Z2EAY4_9TELE|nr:hypothetical protein EYF80_064148 [Liparis tanakae]